MPGEGPSPAKEFQWVYTHPKYATCTQRSKRQRVIEMTRRHRAQWGDHNAGVVRLPGALLLGI